MQHPELGGLEAICSSLHAQYTAQLHRFGAFPSAASLPIPSALAFYTATQRAGLAIYIV